MLISIFDRIAGSIRGRILFSFLAVGTLIGGLGTYAIGSIEEAGELTKRTYDRPLMAINFARSALFAFSAMDRALMRAQFAVDPVETTRQLERIDKLRQKLMEDLAIAEQRSLSARAVAVVVEIAGLVEDWNARRLEFFAGGIDAREWARLDDLDRRIEARFEHLIDMTAGDGFLLRQDALRRIESSRAANSLAVTAALGLALLITYLLGRSILGPLGTATAIAERIAEGELEVAMPAPRNDEIGKLLGSMGVMRDNLRTMMTREVALRKSAEMQLVDAIESLSEAVVLIDAEGSISIVNSEAHALFPTIADHLALGRNFNAAIAAAHRGGFYHASGGNAEARVARYAIPAFGASTIDEEHLADGRWLRASRSRTRNGGMVVIWSDITRMKEREESLRAAKEQAEAASAAKTNFLANMSHELRTPLNAIIGFADILAKEMFGPLGQARYSEYAGDIAESGNHLLDVINDILDISKSEAGKLQLNLQTVHGADIIDTCARIIRDQCDRAGIRFEASADDALPNLIGDPAKIKQILLNLLSNAVKFTPDGGSVTLTAKPAGASEMSFAVTDTGIGMRPEDIAIALEPFGQIDSSLTRKYDGTGLGLPLTKALVQLHEGHLDIASEPNCGTTVTVRLPAAYADAPGSAIGIGNAAA